METVLEHALADYIDFIHDQVFDYETELLSERYSADGAVARRLDVLTHLGPLNAPALIEALLRQTTRKTELYQGWVRRGEERCILVLTRARLELHQDAVRHCSAFHTHTLQSLDEKPLLRIPVQAVRSVRCGFVLILSSL